MEKLQEAEQIGPYFGLPNDWINEWTLFTQYTADDNRSVNRFLFDQFSPPKKIGVAAKPEDYALVPAGVFQAFLELYGCDKVVGRAEPNIESPEAEFAGGYLSADMLALLGKAKAALDADVSDEEIVRICELEHRRIREARAADEPEEEEDQPANQFAGQGLPEDEEDAEEEQPAEPSTEPPAPKKGGESKLSQSTMEETSKLIELSELQGRKEQPKPQKAKTKDSQL